MGQQPSAPSDLAKEIQVIGAGFSRTGTVSFGLALEKLLQGPVCHGGTTLLLREEDYIRKWNAVQDPNASREFVMASLKELTAGYVGTTDIPFNQFVGELCELYPDAIVICSTRNRESWYRSVQKMYKHTTPWWLGAVFFPVPTLRYFTTWTKSVTSLLERNYGISSKEMDNMELLGKHEDYVRRVVPDDRLFFINVKDGWEPLCEILRCPVPDEPFPRANDADSMREFFTTRFKAAMLTWAQIFGATGGAVAVAAYLWRRRRW